MIRDVLYYIYRVILDYIEHEDTQVDTDGHKYKIFSKAFVIGSMSRFRWNTTLTVLITIL
jgi:hypothetical protein